MSRLSAKEKIYYARTYRRIKLNLRESLSFIGFIVLPVLIIYMCNIEGLIELVTALGVLVLSKVIGVEYIQIETTDYSKWWTIRYIDLPTTYPDFNAVCINLIICLIIWLVMQILRKTGRPVAVYMIYCMCVHIVNCVFFIITPESMPYDIGDYSSIYLKQQIGIWMMFIVVAGLSFGLSGKSYLVYKIMAFVGVCGYSFVFGVARYILFLYLLYRFSVLYMAIMFFVVGPMIDFVYFVSIYATFMNTMTREYEKGSKKGEWGWS